MPKKTNVELFCWKLRVTPEHQSWIDDILPIFQKYCDHVSWCREKHSKKNGQGLPCKPHVHLYVETFYTRKTITGKLNEIGLVGNAGFSMQTCERYPIKYLAYMLKEGKCVFDPNMPEDILERVRSHQDEVVNQLQEKKTVVVRIWESLQEDEVFLTLDPTLDSGYAKKYIVKFVVRYHKHNKLLFRRFQVQAYIETILLWWMGTDRFCLIYADRLLPLE